jgi:WD repeat-containing protein 59
MRITFTFPKGYPNRVSDPSGNTSKTVPKIELEKSPLIQDRAFILQRLNVIKERQRPCLEACLRFLLFGEEYDLDRDEKQMESDGEDESSSSDDENPTKRMPRDPTVNMVHKNISEPRTSQGYFAPNGEDLCYFYECILV